MKWHRVDRIPVKRRARVSSSGRVYKDAKTASDMEAVANAYKGPMWDGPVSVWVHVFRPLPKSKPKYVKSEPFVQKLDVDNILKCVMDGLNGVAYIDDRQVVTARIFKLPRTREYDHEWCAFAVEPIYTHGGIENGQKRIQ